MKAMRRRLASDIALPQSRAPQQVGREAESGAMPESKTSTVEGHTNQED